MVVSRLVARLLVVPLALSTIAFGCKDDSSGPDGGGGQGGQGGYGGSGSSVTTVERTIGKSGGRLQTNNVSLFIPSGALTKDRTITVTELDAAAIAELPETTDGIKMSGIPAKFEPHGLTFSEPAEIILGYDEPTNKSEPLAVLKLDNDQDTSWEYVPGAKFESGSSSFEVDGFSIYCVFRDPNGVADMVYGPEEPGSGGTTGSGGQSSGGTGGGSDGGTGGSAGGGGDVNLPGYLDSEFRGFGDTEVGPGAVITVSDLESEPGPNCLEGTTDVDPESFVSLVYYVNQDPDGTQHGPALLSGLGVRLDLTFTTYRQRMVELRGESTTWCARFANEVDGPVFLAWSEFDSVECDNPTGSGDPFDPETDEIEQVAVTVLSNQSAGTPFELCLQELTTGVPNGYLNGATWFGYGSYSFAYASVASDVNDVPAPNCIEGTTDGVAGAYAELGYELNQLADYTNQGAILVGGSGVALDIVSEPPRDLRFRLLAPQLEADYCVDLQDVGSSSFVLQWTDFAHCDTGSQFNASSTPITAIWVRVLSESVVDDPFQLCIDGMDQAP
jgi:hypothetical protein